MATDSIQDIMRRIKSVASTERIPTSMKLVSADKLRQDIGAVKGIGEARLNEIMEIIERDLRLVDKDEA